MDNVILCSSCGGGGLKRLHPLVHIMLESAAEHEYDETDQLPDNIIQKIRELDKKQATQTLKKSIKQSGFPSKQQKEVVRVFLNIYNKIFDDSNPKQKISTLRSLQSTYSRYITNIDPNYSIVIAEITAGNYLPEDLCTTCKGSGYDSRHHPDKVAAYVQSMQKGS